MLNITNSKKGQRVAYRHEKAAGSLQDKPRGRSRHFQRKTRLSQWGHFTSRMPPPLRVCLTTAVLCFRLKANTFMSLIGRALILRPCVWFLVLRGLLFWSARWLFYEDFKPIICFGLLMLFFNFDHLWLLFFVAVGKILEAHFLPKTLSDLRLFTII